MVDHNLVDVGSGQGLEWLELADNMVGQYWVGPSGQLGCLASYPYLVESYWVGPIGLPHIMSHIHLQVLMEFID